MTSIQQSVPDRERSRSDISRSVSGSNLNSEDALCPGCGTSAMREEGGLVVAFGQSFFHVDCFRCAKCHEKVTADTNLLLLSDGSPVCANCTYCCTICQQAINDEAIMAGDDSFHAHCFKCKICKNRIDQLTYARTSHGIYCMDCHNDRVARNRRHAQKKAEMAAVGNGSTKSRSTELKKSDQENERSQNFGHTRAITSKLDGPISNSVPDGSQIPRGVEASDKAKSTQYVNDAFFPPSKGPAVDDRPSSSKGNNISVPPYADSRGVSDDELRPLNVIARPIADKTAKTKLDNDAPPSSFRNNGRLSIPTSSPVNDQPALPSIPPSPTIPHPFAAARLSSSSSRSYMNESGSAVPSTSHSPTPSALSTASNFKQFNGARSPTTASLSSIRSSETDGETIVLNSEMNRQELEHSSQSNGKLSHLVLDQHRTSSRQSYLTSPHARNRGRSPSPVHLIDVPDGVENETDNELEPNSLITEAQQRPLPPTPNLQHEKHQDIRHPEVHVLGSDAPASYQPYISEERELASISGASQAYIAPALPPIRFSLNSGDFSDLLNTVSQHRTRESTQRTTERDNPGRALQVTDANLNARLPNLHSPEHPIEGDLSLLPSLTSRHGADSLTNPEPGRYKEVDDTSRPKRVPSELTSESRPLPSISDEEGLEPILAHIRCLLQDETEAKISLDRKLIEMTVKACEQLGELSELKRTSKQYLEGLTVAQAEYDRELKAKRDAETEVTRLRIILSGQTAQLAAQSCENRRQEQRQKSVHDVHDSLRGLENDLARLIVERDIMLAEIQELSNVKNSNTSSTSFVRSLSQGMENLKGQYQRDLIPLKQERQAFVREISELKTTRGALLEETTVLNARNDEIMSLNQEYTRRLESFPVANIKEVDYARRSQDKNSRPQHSQAINHTLPSTPSANVLYLSPEEDTRNKGNQRNDVDTATPSKKFKWPGSRGKELPQITVINELAKSRPQLEHNFTQVGLLRFMRCEHCGDKMWGSQLRCSMCNLSIHVRCAANVHTTCNQSLATIKDDHSSPAQSMFGRDLTEQATTDCSGADHFVPHIVEKCIEAVETLALDYEGIYRKNGGAGQSRLITQLFERGDCSAFDLRDSERFPDICSVTSVLKNYFRSLPVPLLTFDLYDDFISASQIPDPRLKYETLQQLVKKLPRAHYQTLKKLMLHLHHVHEHNDQNRMNARNLGVVFGPTLMRSRYPGSEFSDMAGKALSIEWLVENAPSILTD